MTNISAARESRDAEFHRVVGPIAQRLERGLVARFGVEAGADAASDAIAWAWEHVDRLAEMSNPAGFLYRVGQSSARRQRRWQRERTRFPSDAPWQALQSPELDQDLVKAMRRLTPDQRVAVLLVHGFGFSYREVADLLGTTETAVTNHVHRGLAKLRQIWREQTA